MKKIKSILLICVMVLSVFLSACGKKGLEKYSDGITEYTINAVYDDQTKTLKVTADVCYVNNYDIELNEIAFHLYPAAYREGARFSPISDRDLTSAYLNGVDYSVLSIDKVTLGGKDTDIKIEGQDEDILIVDLKDYLMPTCKVEVKIDYTLKLPQVRHRLGWFDRTVNLGNFYPVACMYEKGAYIADPYYSTGDPFFTDLANYTVSITADKKYTAAMSGKATRVESGDMATSTSSAKAMRDFAVVLGEFESMKCNFGETEIEYFYYDDENAAQSIKTAADSMATFSEMFGEYPYDHYSVVKTPFLQGGMEYPGLVYISDSVTGNLYDEVIVHETAHQWWYGMVGNDQVRNPWMDEGLTEYTTSLFYERNPSYNVKFTDRIADALSAFVLYCDKYKQGGKGDTSMIRKVSEYADNYEYSYMIYVKGELMFDALRKTIGDKAFFDGLKNYFKDNYLQIAIPADMIAAFEKSAKNELEGFFNSWLNGTVKLFADYK